MTAEFDSIIVGTGQAGPSLAARLSASGRHIAVIERGKFGGTCVNTGCIPTKAMVASAYAAHIARRAGDYGVHIAGGVSVDMKQVKARKDRIAGESQEGVEKSLRGMANCTVYEGHARFEGPHRISVGETTLSAPEIFLNVGGRASIPAIAGLERVPYLTNSSMMEVDFLPRHLVILGGSYIAIEFGQMFRRFGSEVTIVERGGRLVSREDADVSQAIQSILEDEGIEIRLKAKAAEVSMLGEEAAVRLESGRDVRGSHLLVAMGRRPNTGDLQLDKAGIATDERGYVIVDDRLKTNVTGIWALGDCNGKGAFTHTSYNDYEIAAANLLDHDTRLVSDRIPAYCMYIDPPLGRVGLSEAQVRESGRNALMATRSMTKVSRAVEKGETQGFMKIIVDAETKMILGASILGTGGDEAIHSILDVMYAKAPYTVIQRAMHIHPTVSELIPTMLADLKPLSEESAS